MSCSSPASTSCLGCLEETIDQQTIIFIRSDQPLCELAEDDFLEHFILHADLPLVHVFLREAERTICALCCCCVT